MKPSEQFAELKLAVESMEEGQDKADLLALFQCADNLHRRVENFKWAISGVKKMITRQNNKMDEFFSGLKIWVPLLKSLDKPHMGGKVVDIDAVKQHQRR